MKKFVKSFSVLILSALMVSILCVGVSAKDDHLVFLNVNSSREASFTFQAGRRSVNYVTVRNFGKGTITVYCQPGSISADEKVEWTIPSGYSQAIPVSRRDTFSANVRLEGINGSADLWVASVDGSIRGR